MFALVGQHGRVLLYNHPRSGVDGRTLRRLVRVAAPHGLGPADLYVAPQLRVNPFRAEVRCAGAVTPFIEIQLNYGLSWPWFQDHDAKALRDGYLPWGWLLGPDELLLACLAHEFRHLWQARRGRPLSDTDADRWALSRLVRYRQ